MTFPSEERRQRRWGRKTLVSLALLGAAGVLWVPRIQVLEIGAPGVLWRVSPGEVFTLRYTQSMYGVEVNERFRVGSGSFTLFQVSTTPAALEYLGLEHGRPNNVHRTLRAFRVPVASVGKHQLLFKDRAVALNSLAGGRNAVPVRVVTLNPFQYSMHVLGGSS